MVAGPQLSPLSPLWQCPVHCHPHPIKNWDVYVDDFINAAQGNSKHWRHVKRVLLESLDLVLGPLDQHDVPPPLTGTHFSQEYAGRRCNLGHSESCSGMDDRYYCYGHPTAGSSILDSIAPTQCRTMVNKWHKLMGDLRSMVIAIPGGKGLFSVLQNLYPCSKSLVKDTRMEGWLTVRNPLELGH
jgi:hypothetical protein